MHIDFVAEGWEPDLRQFEEWMNTRVFPMEIEHKDGKKETINVPGALRPRRAYTYVFPRENLDRVLNTLGFEDSVARVDGKGTKILGTTIKVIRKFLRLKPLPKPDESKGTFAMVNKNIRLIGLGYREDGDFVNEHGIKQETL